MLRREPYERRTAAALVRELVRIEVELFGTVSFEARAVPRSFGLLRHRKNAG